MQRFEKWTETYKNLVKADQDRALELPEMETLALAAFLTGRDTYCYDILERAHHGYLTREKTEQAVRCAFWLGLMLINAGEKARGSGWMARTERLLSDEQRPECAEKGLLLIPAALGALSSGQAANAQKLFEQAITIGEKFDDIDLIALGRLGKGQAMIQQGIVAKGIKLLDETMIIVETEEIFPLVKGIIYCAVVETCRKIWDLRRAQEWTLALTRWIDSQPDILPFRGQCLVRRAEIFQLQGEWPIALEQSHNACKLLTRPPGQPAAGEAFYLQAELKRLMGDFEEAERCYIEAAKWSRKPQPGLALLRLAQGLNEDAETSIKNTLKETKEIKRRAELLPGFIKIMVAVRRTEEALQATKELHHIARKFDTPYLYAISSYCQGSVLIAEGNFQVSKEHLYKALKIWDTLHLPYESALTRELIGLVYRKLNDKDNSNLELAAAKWVFEQLNSQPDLDRINRMLNGSSGGHKSHGLSLRELQVLRLVTSGKTNKSVAGELFISERTVDRHVSNIFNKLNVSSRVEATSFAFKNQIFSN